MALAGLRRTAATSFLGLPSKGWRAMPAPPTRFYSTKGGADRHVDSLKKYYAAASKFGIENAEKLKVFAEKMKNTGSNAAFKVYSTMSGAQLASSITTAGALLSIIIFISENALEKAGVRSSDRTLVEFTAARTELIQLMLAREDEKADMVRKMILLFDSMIGAIDKVIDKMSKETKEDLLKKIELLENVSAVVEGDSKDIAAHKESMAVMLNQLKNTLNKGL